MYAKESPTQTQGGATDRRGIEYACAPLALQDVQPIGPPPPPTRAMITAGANARPNANESQGHPARRVGVSDMRHRFQTPGFVRRLLKPAHFENQRRELTGTEHVGPRGVNIEPASSLPVDAGEIGGEVTIEIMGQPQPIEHDKAGQPNFGTLVEQAHGEPFVELRALRANFPYLPIAQFPPQTVSKLLAANVAQELVLPDGAVICRISWQVNTDLIVTLHGQARMPAAGDSPSPQSFGIGMEGMILNPDSGTWFYCKGIRTISALTPTAGGSVVNVQTYVGSYNVRPQAKAVARA